MSMRKKFFAVLLLLLLLCILRNDRNTSRTAVSINGSEAAEPETVSETGDIQNFYVTNTGDRSNLYYIDEDHILWGSGKNEYGQLGQGALDNGFHEEPVKIAENVIHVDYSPSGFMIYLTEDHKLYGTGNAMYGALWTASKVNIGAFIPRAADVSEIATAATPVLLMEHVTYACCGRDDVVCIKEDSSVWTWGTIGHHSWITIYFDEEPVQILENARLITGGMYNHAALLEDGTLWTWGYNYSGNCGVEDIDIIERPTQVADEISMVWTGTVQRNIDCQNISALEDTIINGLENTIIRKNDGSIWACGTHIGSEKKMLPYYWEETDYYLTCTSDFTPFESIDAVLDIWARLNQPIPEEALDLSTLSPMEAFQKVLLSEAPFTMLEPSGQNRYIGYLNAYPSEGKPEEFLQFAIQDLDGDNIPEMILLDDDTENIILRYRDGKVIGYGIGYKAMSAVQKNGIFIQTSGASEIYRCKLFFIADYLLFDPIVEEYEYIEPYIYYVYDIPVTKEEKDHVLAVLYENTEEIVWRPFTEDEILKLIAEDADSKSTSVQRKERQDHLDSLSYLVELSHQPLPYDYTAQELEAYNETGKKYYDGCVSEMHKIYELCIEKLPDEEANACILEQQTWQNAIDERLASELYKAQQSPSIEDMDVWELYYTYGSLYVRRIVHLVDLYYGYSFSS